MNPRPGDGGAIAVTAHANLCLGSSPTGERDGVDAKLLAVGTSGCIQPCCRDIEEEKEESSIDTLETTPWRWLQPIALAAARVPTARM